MDIFFSSNLKISKKLNPNFCFLSNFFFSSFTKNGVVYTTNEHFFQSEKYDDPEIRELIISASTPREAKKLGSSFEINRELWDSKRDMVMKEGLWLKFSQNPDLKEKLISTKNAKLREFSNNDKYWGGSIKGSQNRLGILLMEIREEIKKLNSQT